MKPTPNPSPQPTTDGPLEGSPEDWIQELRSAGWTSKGIGVWISPGGIMFRGPALALKKKRAHPELAYLTMGDLYETRFHDGW